MPVLQLHTAFAPHEPDKPLPSLPSPTLTNPDLVLPDGILPGMTSPPRRRLDAPPSPSYLRDPRDSPRSSPRSATTKNERSGLMSRKMMLLRGRTNSGPGNPYSPAQSVHDRTSLLQSSPTLQDVGNLAPERPASAHRLHALQSRRPSASGSSSSDLSALNGFLARYTKNMTASDDEAEVETERPQSSHAGSDHGENEAEEKRRIQEQEEYESAILSKRAEQILANAKKRLNVMEGNLRGARDLVAPLTAANLKRAASLGSNRYTPAYTRRFDSWAMGLDDSSSQHGSLRRRLPIQASSPSLNRDYASHARGFSETELPERSRSAMESQQPTARLMRMPVRVDPSWAQSLRASRSYEALANAGLGPPSMIHDQSIHMRGSPDLRQLEPLREDDDDEPKRAVTERYGYARSVDARTYDGFSMYSRPSSRTSDLRDQMSTLRGKISSLQERAREEKMRRQGASQSRTASPLNNALGSPLDFDHASSPGSSQTTPDPPFGPPRTSSNEDRNGPPTPQSGSRAFTDGQRTLSRLSSSRESASKLPLPDVDAYEQSFLNMDSDDSYPDNFPFPNDPTADNASIGVAISDDRASRKSWHQHQHTASSGAIPQRQDPADQSGGQENESSRVRAAIPASNDDTTPVSATAEHDELADTANVVPHEERDDAFDYEHFFLHSSMARYNIDDGNSDSDASTSSASTARGPLRRKNTHHHGGNGGDVDVIDEVIDFDDEDEQLVVPAPGTPERLRAIERELGHRPFSSDSISTLNTYATAMERHSSSDSDDIDDIDFDLPPPPPPPPTTGRPISRPGTAIKRDPPPSLSRHDSGSERADSGVGMISAHRSTGSDGAGTVSSNSTTVIGNGPSSPRVASVGTSTRSTPRLGPPMTSPPTSPNVVAPRDPIAIAVNALLNPSGLPLGLKDKATLFGVMESLRLAVHGLQGGMSPVQTGENDTSPNVTSPQDENEVFRNRLEDVKKLLDTR